MALNTPTAPPEAAARQLITEMGAGYILSSALQLAAALGIADRLASGPQTARELADAAHVLEDPLYRVLRLLASAGVFHEIDGRRFTNNVASDLLRKENPHGAYPMVRWITEPMHFKVFANLMHSMKTGKPAFDKTMGQPVFEYVPTDPELSDIFNDAMTAFSAAVIPAVIKAYSFDGISVLVDVAGGHGAVLTSVLQQYPHLRGILMDVDHVIPGARRKIAALDLADRCQAVVGDFFNAVPEGGDAYIMKHIIHDWDDERAALILRNIHAALKGQPNGRVVLLEAVIPPPNEPHFGKLLDLEMLAYPGGRERTADEFTQLFAQAGFRLTRIVPTESALSVIEANPV